MTVCGKSGTMEERLQTNGQLATKEFLDVEHRRRLHCARRV